MSTHTLRRALSALAASALAVIGVALTPITAHADAGPTMKLNGTVVAARGELLHYSLSGYPASALVNISLTYAHLGGGSGGQLVSYKRVNAAGSLTGQVGVPDALPTQYDPTSVGDDFEVVATTTDGAVSTHQPWRLLPAPATTTVTPASAHVGDTVHVHAQGYFPGQHVDLELGESTDDIGINHRLGLYVADASGVIDTDVTVPQVDLAAEALGYNDSPKSTIFASSAVNGFGIMPAAPLRIVPPTTDLTGVPDLCRDDSGGSWRTDGGHGAGPSVCVYTRDGAQGSARPGDTVQAVGHRWYPGSTVDLYVTRGCEFSPTPGSGCTIDGEVWHPGTDAIRLGSVKVGLDGVIGPQPLKVPSFPAAWVGTPTSVVAVGPHTPVYLQAGDAMGTIGSNYAWTLTPADPPPPVVTPTPTPTPTTPKPSPSPPTKPTPSPSSPDPTKPVPSPSTPTPHRSTAPPPTTTKTHLPPAKTPTPPKAVGPPLASTGSQTGLLLGVAGLLLAVGTLAMLAGRKRRHQSHRA